MSMKYAIGIILGVIMTTFWFSAAITATRCTEIGEVEIKFGEDGYAQWEVIETPLYKKLNLYSWSGVIKNLWDWNK